MKHLALILIALFVPLSAHAQTDIETVVLTPKLHMLISPAGGNVTVSSGKDGTFIIDDQLEGRSEIVSEAIKAITPTPIKFILNTHYHFDHTGGNVHFGDKNAIIVAHDNVRERLSADQFITHFKKEMPAMAAGGLPVVTFADNMKLHYNGDTVEIIHVANAHTDGDAIAIFKDQNVIVAGDTIFNFMYPFIDSEHGGSLKGMIAAQDVILSNSDDATKIIPGHGPVMSKTELQDYRDTLNAIAENINKLKAQGMSNEEIIAAKPTAAFAEKLKVGVVEPDDFVKLVLDGL